MLGNMSRSFEKKNMVWQDIAEADEKWQQAKEER